MARLLILAISLFATLSCGAGEYHGDERPNSGPLACSDIYYPGPKTGLKAPYPLIVLVHGFGRAPGHHKRNAEYLAEHGFVVVVPDDNSTSGVVELVGQVRERCADKKAKFWRIVDMKRIGLAGHSAGGCACLGATCCLQGSDTPIKALCLLDAVAKPSQFAEAACLKPFPLVSLRSEVSPCNGQGCIALVLEAIPFSVWDVKLVGATHCDPENPSDVLCGGFCGSATKKHQLQYRDLMYLFFRESLQGRRDGRFVGTLEAMKKAGDIVPRQTADKKPRR